MTKNNKTIVVKGIVIATLKSGSEDYISLTDIARNKNAEEPKDVVKNWMRSRTTVEFLGIWEELYNPDFKGVEFDSFLFEAGSNSFTLSPSKWIAATNAKGIISKVGKNGGTFAHKDIAFEFASWISSGFKLYLIKEFQRLKEDENKRLNLGWNLQRTISKINYKIQTDAIKENLIPKEVSRYQESFIYASEADLLNVALFGITAKQWREANPEKEGNLRDDATIEQLVVLSNLESINALLIAQELKQTERLFQLNKVAIAQMKSLVENNSIKKLK
ncbi:KilA-N domain-containing protein [Flavobacterium gawalongense]|uniref:KilA-N domain-containing protein n=1 Tax=Flavobacterium gawalongense TaxID=2594432 RepID=A0A553BBJ0_9FLAO|nr:KilA-N domain-containing protein [Flavobacterium gawalongense]TRW98010.1 KilA-N domain-containing protein [Flavobacterium gawalongense]TRX02509.1 KilA-N domain-containing protein [Flavobacterium gawalongense]TRX05608.1 KilA-N domain-containing protein [Flavobacterium gawalongense]TRX06491.1 KilA-N domain-containing protein [Flavobacterium gawalongense]TRX25033.1 KilA-N domain-containing protein [Flavobacterium gawalongense]